MKRTRESAKEGHYTYDITHGIRFFESRESRSEAWKDIASDARSRYWDHTGKGPLRIPGYE